MNQTKDTSHSRRDFLLKSSIGVGVLLGVSLSACSPIRQKVAKSINNMDSTYKPEDGPMIWFELTQQNKVILHSPKVEMGQGIFTGLAQLVAEELDIRMDQIKVVHASTIGRPVDPRSTGNSDSLSSLWQPLRALAAKMRQMLLNNAAELLAVPANVLSVKEGVISGTGKSITYGEVVQRSTKWEIPDEVQLKNRQDFTIIGQSIPRVDLQAKVLGEPIYGFDARLPNMLYGSIVRPIHLDTEFVRADIAKAAAMPGVVKVVVEKDFVGVVAKSKVQADLAKKAVDVVWKTKRIWQQTEIEALTKVGQGKAVTIQKLGKTGPLLKEDGMEASYSSPIGAHAQIEPNGAVAHVTKDKAIILISTQVAKITQEEVAKRIGLDKDQVEVKTTFLGGGFGRRLHTPNAMQAAVLSKAVGQPVHVFYNRKEEFQHDTFRPPTHHVLKGKLDAQGKIQALEHHVSSGDVAFGSPFVTGLMRPLIGADFGAWRGGMIQYQGIPNVKAVSWLVDLPFATSWWRGLGLLANTFAIESFMDELAEQAGKDPVQFRLEHLSDDVRNRRLKGVIEAAAQKAAWGQHLAPGRAQGIAASIDANTPVAQVVELSIEDQKIKIHKVTCAIDPGLVINPDSVKAQCEGAIIMGLSATLFEKMTIKDGSIGPTIYGDYQMALMKDAPDEIEVVLLESGGDPSGVGEPPIGPIAAATANAIFKLTGQRLRDLPLRLS
jgi:isoquinoline 1-oxidoreductase beta subunit